MQHDYFSSFNKSDHRFLVSVLPLPSCSLKFPIACLCTSSFPIYLSWYTYVTFLPGRFDCFREGKEPPTAVAVDLSDELDASSVASTPSSHVDLISDLRRHI